MQWPVHLGAAVGISARHDVQRQAAETLGLALEVPRSADVVFEASGTPSGFDDAVKHCRRGGTLVLVSTTWEPISISFLNAQMREITIVPAFVYGEAHGEREFDTAVKILAAHPEIAAALITHRFGLDDATARLRRRRRPRPRRDQGRPPPVVLNRGARAPMETEMDGIAAVQARIQEIESQFGTQAARAAGWAAERRPIPRRPPTRPASPTC